MIGVVIVLLLLKKVRIDSLLEQLAFAHRKLTAAPTPQGNFAAKLQPTFR
jgi:hypothetical protein